MKSHKLLLISVLIISFLILTPVLTTVIAVPNKIKINECSGMGILVSKWEWTGGGFVESESHPDYDITVTGNAVEAYWTANPAIQGVVSKEGTERFIWYGGMSGTVIKDNQQDISHITFCANTEVPEFSMIGGIIVIMGTILIILVKRH